MSNNFNIIRIVLAIIVILNHIYSITEDSRIEFLGRYFDSNFAVKCFFTISGYLVTHSLLSSSSIKQYAKKRFLRLYPAYFFTIFLCMLIGAAFSNLSLKDYFSSMEVVRYLAANLSLQNYIQPTLPGVFLNNPLQTINGSLWTIKVEVMLYMSLPIIVYLYKRGGATPITFLIYGISTLWILYFSYIYEEPYSAEISRQFPGQLCYFVIGSFFAFSNNAIKKIRWFGFLAIFILLTLQNTFIFFLLKPFAYSLIILCLALDRDLIFKCPYTKDISYGLYLFHFPIIQILISINIFKYDLLLGIILTLAISLFAASLSEKFIERYFLRNKSIKLLSS